MLRALSSGSHLCLTMEYAPRGDLGRLWRPPTFWSTQEPAWSALRHRLAAAVHTDLPQRHHAAPSVATLTDEERHSLPPLHVQAVAAHERTKEELLARLRAARAADGLLLVSGGERAPSAASAAPALLRLAAQLRREGELEAETALLVAANPHREDLSGLQAKLDAGAEAVVTQPALNLSGRFERWIEAASGALGRVPTGRVPLLVGVACPATPAEVRLWLRLIGVDEMDAGATELLGAWRRAEAEGRVGEHAEAEARRAIRRAKEAGASGLHLMPVTHAGYGLAARLHDEL